MRKSKIIVLSSFIFLLLVMAVGYSAFATNIKLDGQAEISGIWDVRITGIEVASVSEGCDAGDPTYTNTSATFNAKLIKPGDSVTYVITIQNRGTIDAKLSTVYYNTTKESTETINYESTSLKKVLEAGGEDTLAITIKYDENTSILPEVRTSNITGIIEYVQKP